MKTIRNFRTRGFISAVTGRLFSAGSYEGSFKGELEKFRTIVQRESPSQAGAAI